MTTTELKISSWRTYECVNRVEECAGVDSYYLLAKDGKPMEGLLPGQYVYVKANFPSTGEFGPASFPVSSAPDAGLLRLTVKYVSERNQVDETSTEARLHRLLKVGETIELSEPFGEFTFNFKEEHPVVIIAAGICIAGVVPLLSALSTENPLRELHFLYSAANSARYPLKSEVDSIMKGLPHGAKAVFFTSPLEGDVIGRDYDAQGRISAERIRFFCQDPDADFWLAGPKEFMESVKAALLEIGVIEPRIHCEDYKH